MSDEEIIKHKWKEFLEVQKLSEVTIKEYSRYFGHLDFEELTPNNLTRWIHRHNNEVARAFLTKFIDFVVSYELIDEQEILLLKAYRIPPIRGRKKVRYITTITREQVHALANAFKQPRLKMMVLCTFYLGLRRKELLGLRFKDINWEDIVIKISYEIAKGKKERILPIPKPLQAELVDYFDSMPEGLFKEALKENVLLFPVSKSEWARRLREMSFEIIGYKVKPHELRHSCGTYLQQQGLDLKEIAEYLGHKSITTTQIYIHLDKDNLTNKIQKAFI